MSNPSQDNAESKEPQLTSINTGDGLLDSSPSSAGEESADVDTHTVLTVAMNKFANLGFTEAKLEAIAKESGMSKRMLHYHFGDKKGLYRQTLEHAITLLRPAGADIDVPAGTRVVDGVRQVTEALFAAYVDNPDAVRMLLLENLHHYGKVGEGNPILDQSEVMLQLDKLLMRGQDSGAFRPGISAMDVFTLVISLAVFRTSHRSTMLNLYNFDTLDEDNTVGMSRMATDAVLTFLTSNLKSTTQVSYLTAGEGFNAETEESESASYDVVSDIFEI